MTRENVVPPALMLRQLAFVMRASRALYAAAELNIADFLASGPLTTAELATAVGADAAALRRLMRALVAHGVFEEEIGDSFRLNAAGELMRRDVPGSQRSATTCSANETSERAPQKIPVASATTPAMNQTMTQIWLSETPTDRAA